MGRARLGWFAALTLVLLRLAIGWHFLSEGGEKLAYDPETGRYSVTFSAEGFLAGAQGPLAGLMEGLAPGEHRWRQLLAVPQQDKPLAEDEQTESHPPYHAWHQQIVADWHEAANRAKGDLAEGQLADADAALAAHEQQLAEYLAEIEADVTDYQHELWRLEQWEHDPKAGELPYFDERIATKRAEVNRLPRPWIGQVTTFGQDLQNELAAMSDNHASANPTQPAPRSRLDWVNLTVTCLTIGVGICLLLGFFTRVAALAGGLFLISVMASQPPWVAGANTEYFFYQLVEVAALAVLFATAAGRWLGLDFFSYAIWNYLRGEDF